MSHSSGIPVSESLKHSFGNARVSGNKRLIKVSIENDEMVEVDSRPPKGSWDEDLSHLGEILEEKVPCYILYKGENDEWVLMSYVPDKCKVREKMIYASSRGNLKQQLGSNYFVDELQGTVPGDFSKEGYESHRTHKQAEAPLTDKEEVRRRELESGEIYTGGASTYVHGIAFPVETKVVDTMKQLISGSLNYVQVAIDVNAEKVICDHSGNISIDDLSGKISTTEPRFHFFAYKHDFEGQSLKSTVFVYSCPDGSKDTTAAPVKMRMIYSSSKENVSSILTQVGGTIDLKLEVNSPDEISSSIIFEALHPPKEQASKGFSKPTRPGKGGRRLIKK